MTIFCSVLLPFLPLDVKTKNRVLMLSCSSSVRGTDGSVRNSIRGTDDNVRKYIHRSVRDNVRSSVRRSVRDGGSIVPLMPDGL